MGALALEPAGGPPSAAPVRSLRTPGAAAGSGDRAARETSVGSRCSPAGELDRSCGGRVPIAVPIGVPMIEPDAPALRTGLSPILWDPCRHGSVGARARWRTIGGRHGPVTPDPGGRWGSAISTEPWLLEDRLKHIVRQHDLGCRVAP